MRIEIAEQISKAELEQLARKHLWPCFSALSETGTYPLIVSGDGCYVFDDDDKRYLDGLAGLFLTNVGHCSERFKAVRWARRSKRERRPVSKAPSPGLT